MEIEKIAILFKSFEDAKMNRDDVECWSARDLMPLLGYSNWQNFVNVIKKAKQAALNADITEEDHFIDINKMIETGKNAQREIDDIAMTRYACYLVAQNGDPIKEPIAFAQTYFAIQTRKQEMIAQRMLDVVRVQAREKLSGSEKKFSGVLYERGVDDQGFALIRSKGDQALFGGNTTLDMKRRFGVPEKRPLADFLPTLTIKAKDFAVELTSHNVKEKDLVGQSPITIEHEENNLAMRKTLIERGVYPEKLPPAEDIQKTKRRLDKEEKRILNEGKKVDK
jgi:DNA-damage-inducible protein D